MRQPRNISHSLQNAIFKIGNAEMCAKNPKKSYVGITSDNKVVRYCRLMGCLCQCPEVFHHDAKNAEKNIKKFTTDNRLKMKTHLWAVVAFLNKISR
ncbi:MAG: hypothetical protein K2N03_04205, partial [Muribaculaceae bacterium]|nr:hypothetical protein [Muribaculaceae bacterium]